MNNIDILNFQKGIFDLEIPYKIYENKHIHETEIIDFFENSKTIDLLKYSKYLSNRNNPTNLITYSRKIFINLINLCKDTCSYCTYKKEP
ncbi:MAG TPA: hypothetical protein VGC75_01000, partial [Candidatus Nitrosocosmicus sp.]